MISRLFNHTIFCGIAFVMLIAATSCGGPSSEDIKAEFEKPIEYADYNHTTDVVYLFPAEMDGKWGFIDTLGRIVIKPQYSDAWDFAEGYAAVEFEGSLNQSFIDHNNERLTDAEFDHVGNFQNGYAYVSKDGFFGFIDITGELVIPIKFEDVYDFEHGKAIAGQGNKYGLIDTTGSFVLPPDFKDISYFSSGYADVEGEEGMGLIDSTGKLLIAPVYDNLMAWGDATVEVEKGDKMGMFVIDGETVNLAVPVKYDDVYYHADAKVFVCEDGDAVDIIDKRGRQIGARCNDVIDVDTNVIVVEQDWNYRILDLRGKPVTKKDYESIYGFFDGYAAASINDKCGYLDKSGNEAIVFEYDESFSFGEGLACVGKDGKFGYINREGEVVIPLQFQSGAQFSNGRAAVKSEGSWGYIDVNGNWIVAPKYTAAYDYGEKGFTYVESGAKMGLLDINGNVVINLKYHDIFEIDLEKGLWEIERNDLVGVANSKNQVLLEPIYDEVYDLGNFILLEKGQYYGLAKLNGEIILEPLFDDVLEMDRGMISFMVTKSVKGETKDFYGYVNSTGEIVWWPYDRKLLKQRVL